MDKDLIDKDAVLKNYRSLGNDVLIVSGYGYAEYPREIVDTIYQDYRHEMNKSGIEANTDRIDILRLVLNSLDTWRQAIVNLDNSNIPANIEKHHWDYED